MTTAASYCLRSSYRYRLRAETHRFSFTNSQLL